MHPNRRRTKSAALVVAGLIPVAGVLAGASSSSTGHVASPEPVLAADVEHVAEKPVAKAPAETQKSVRKESTSVTVFPASVTSGEVPKTNFKAYRAAETTMARTDPTCRMGWKLIAGIGKVESHHANFGDVDADGELRTPIYGPVLNGSLAGNQVISDTDGGKLDGNAAYDRAVGPMQFLPSTWKHYGADGNGDEKTDPQNVFDAALTTARYLCDEGLDMKDGSGETQAVLRYNNSMDYVSKVTGFARSY
nr:lytic murein transglycosylase [Gordonia zhaorongruii]